MGKNIAIVVLSLCLLLCVYQLMDSAWRASVLRGAEWQVRVAGYHVWRQACDHAAAGDRSRQKWCDAADRQTATAPPTADLNSLAADTITAKH